MKNRAVRFYWFWRSVSSGSKPSWTLCLVTGIDDEASRSKSLRTEKKEGGLSILDESKRYQATLAADPVDRDQVTIGLEFCQ